MVCAVLIVSQVYGSGTGDEELLLHVMNAAQAPLWLLSKPWLQQGALHKRHEMNRISHLFFQPFPPQASSTGKQPPSGFHVQHASTRRCCLYPPLLPLTLSVAAESSPSCHLFLLSCCPLVLFLATLPPPL